jgi:lipopolysaccharide/colanic/teichoic acid biosynthesis glycosyltransferase
VIYRELKAEGRPHPGPTPVGPLDGDRGEMIRRTLEIVTVVVGLLLIWPVFLLIALVIVVTSPGPILFAQTRVGRHGKPFTIFKFRSMVSGADKLGSSVTTGDDARITPVGRFLRRTKLDELPQLWNVLSGDMSLVGPRPEVPEIVAHYTPAMYRILEVRPGITSIASLNLQDEEILLAALDDPDRAYLEAMVPFKVLLAMKHVDQGSIWFDIKVLVLTLYSVLLGRWWPLSELRQVTEFKNHLLHDYGK